MAICDSGSGFAVTRYPKGLARDTLWRGMRVHREVQIEEPSHTAVVPEDIHQHHSPALSRRCKHCNCSNLANPLQKMLLKQGKTLPKSAAHILKFHFQDFVLQTCPLRRYSTQSRRSRASCCRCWTTWKSSRPTCGWNRAQLCPIWQLQC